MELIADMIVNSTGNKQLETLIWVVCMQIKALSLKVCQ